MPDFHEGRVFRPAPVIEDAPVEMTEPSPVEPAADIKNDIEERAKDLAWDMLPAELKDNLMQAATTTQSSVSETPAAEEEKSYGGAVDPVELRDDNLEDMGRRLILWSAAVAPVTRPLSRAEGGSVEYPGGMTEDDRRAIDRGDAHLTHMSPKEFLDEARPLHLGHHDKHVVKTFKNDIEAGHKLSDLKLYEDGKEDGRHRATAAKKLGVKSLPVVDYRKANGGTVIKSATKVLSKLRGK